MIGASDIIRLDYTPDLTEAGITYACRSLPHTYNRMGGSPPDRMRRIAAGVAVELAFRRHLFRQEVPFDVKGTTPFTDPDRYDVSLGGHRCDIKSFLITHKNQISALHLDPTSILHAPALVPFDQYSGEGHREDDLYLFAFTTGLLAASTRDTQKARRAGQPVHLIHTMPRAWNKPRSWVPMRLALKSESDRSLQLEIGGQNAEREFIVRRIKLQARQRIEIREDFHSLAYLHVGARPGARIGLHSPALPETHLVEPSDWNNIWVYGMDIYLAGWIPRQEFRQRAHVVQKGSRVFQYNRTRTKNLAVNISDLKPLSAFLERVQQWKETGH